MPFLLLLGAALIAAPLVYEMWEQKQRGLKPMAGPNDKTPSPVAVPTKAATSSPLSDDVYALSRMIASEAGSEPLSVQEAVAWVARNEAARRNVSVWKLLTSPDGQYGAQNRARGVYASTARNPTPAQIDLARRVLSAPAASDPTQGGLHFDSPRAQRALLARGTKGYGKTPEQVAEERRKDGFKVLTLAGVPEDQFRVWRRA